MESVILNEVKNLRDSSLALLRNKNCFLHNERRPPARRAELRMTVESAILK